MEMKLTFVEAQTLARCLVNCADLEGTLHFGLSCPRNVQRLAPDVQTYQKKRKKISETNCLRDEKEAPVRRKNEAGQLVYTYADPKVEADVLIEINELDNYEIEVDLIPLAEKDLPEKGITPRIAGGLMLLLPKEEKKKPVIPEPPVPEIPEEPLDKEEAPA